MKARSMCKVKKDRRFLIYEVSMKVMIPIFIVAVMIGLIGCGGSGGGDGGGLNSASVSGVQDGVFVDSPVQGLHYETNTQSGTTDANGKFFYMEGETVTFSMGDLVLGEAMAAPVMTPIDMVPDATDETHPTVTNMIRFMQTLDEDNNLDNGIFLPPYVMEELQGRQIDFNMDPVEFESDVDVQMFMDILRAMYASYADRMMVNEEDAQLHMRNTMMGIVDGNVQNGDGTMGGNMQSGGGMMF
jgi:hypothetical protein